MDKLKRYNQKLLAIIGTTVIAVAGVTLIIGLGAAIFTMIDFSNDNDQGVKIQNQKTTSPDGTQEFIRTQEVTFNSPEQLDTAQTKFIITVGQVNLETKEKVALETADIKFSGSGYRYQSYYGLFNNFVYLDYEQDIKQKLFDKQVAITEWAFVKNDSIEILLFKGTSTDDNGDNQMDYDDYQSLFVFYIYDRHLVQYDFEGKTVLNFEPMKKTDLISIELGIDKNADFDFDSYREPQVVSTLNIRTRQVDPLIGDELKNEIQTIIDGV